MIVLFIHLPCCLLHTQKKATHSLHWSYLRTTLIQTIEVTLCIWMKTPQGHSVDVTCRENVDEIKLFRTASCFNSSGSWFKQMTQTNVSFLQAWMESTGTSPAVASCAPTEKNRRIFSLSSWNMDASPSRDPTASTCVQTRAAHSWAMVWQSMGPLYLSTNPSHFEEQEGGLQIRPH